MIEFIARGCPQAVWRLPPTLAPTHAFPRRMKLSAHGALNVGTDARLFLGKSMGTGRKVGILIRQRYALMSSICLTMQRADLIRPNLEFNAHEAD